MFATPPAPWAGVAPTAAVIRAQHELDRLNPGGTRLVFVSLQRSRDPFGAKAWEAIFNPPSGRGSGYSGCSIFVNTRETRATRYCVAFRR